MFNPFPCLFLFFFINFVWLWVETFCQVEEFQSLIESIQTRLMYLKETVVPIIEEEVVSLCICHGIITCTIAILC